MLEYIHFITISYQIQELSKVHFWICQMWRNSFSRKPKAAKKVILQNKYTFSKKNFSLKSMTKNILRISL